MINNQFFLGVVEDRNDPKRMGRVRVRVFSAHTHERKVDVPIETLPWSFVVQPPNDSTAGATHSQLVEGTWVLVMYVDDKMQDPLVIGSIPGINEEEPDYTKGFSDPFQVYPRWTGEDSELSLVSNEDLWLEHPTYDNRVKERITEIPRAKKFEVPAVVPGGGGEEYERVTWDEPDLRGEQESNYPYNAVREYEGGMIEEYDSTSDNTRITQMHQSGTYREILDDGTTTIKVVGDHYTLTLKDQNMYIQGDLNVTVEGNMRQLVQGDYILEVDGNKHEYVRGNRESKIDGSDALEVNTNQSIAITGENSLHCGGNQTIIVDSNYIRDVAANSNRTIGGDESTNVSGNINDTAGGNLTESASNIFMN